MFKKLFSQAQKKDESSSDQQAGDFRMVSAGDMLRYEFQDLLFQKIFETEAVLHDEEDPMVIRYKKPCCRLAHQEQISSRAFIALYIKS